jgi:hypothetical protein
MRISIRKATYEDIKYKFSNLKEQNHVKFYVHLSVPMVFVLLVSEAFLSLFFWKKAVLLKYNMTISSTCCRVLLSSLKTSNMISNSTCSYPLINRKFIRTCSVSAVSAVRTVHVCFILSIIFLTLKLYSVGILFCLLDYVLVSSRLLCACVPSLKL